MYSNLNLKILVGMTPPAIKLYEFAKSRTLPTTIGIDDFQRVCGIEPSVPGCAEEVERVCRELVSANVVKAAYLHDGLIHLK